MNNIKEYISQKIREYDASLDTRTGSALHDLLINPASVILGNLKDLQDKILQYQTLESPESIPTDVMDSFAKSYLVTRSRGGPATGYVRLFFDEPVTISIPNGCIFESDTGQRYKTTRTNVFTAEDMSSNTYGSYYATGDIFIQAFNDGIESNADEGTITKVLNPLSTTPAFIKNLSKIQGGVKTDSNLELYEKIIQSAINENLFSDVGIKTLLENYISGTKVIKIVGMGDSEMTRDLVYSGYYYQLYNNSDYYGAMGDVSGPITSTIPSGYLVSGYVASGYVTSGIITWSHYYPFNQSSAYYAPYFYSGTLVSSTLPRIAEFNSEFSLEQYSNMYKPADTYFATVETRTVLDEEFLDPMIEHRGWLRSDADAGPGHVHSSRQIEVSDGLLRLGYNPSIDSAVPRQIVIDSGIVALIRHLIRRANNLPREAYSNNGATS